MLKVVAKNEKQEELRDPFVAYLQDDLSRQAALSVTRQRGWPAGEVMRGGAHAAVRGLGAAQAPEIVLLDVSQDEIGAAHQAIAEFTRQGSKVIALGDQNDVSLYRRLAEAGARDYLVKPVDTEMLAEAISRLEAPVNANGRRGRVIGVLGARGGSGASTVAVNTAWLLSEQNHRRVLLVDLDLCFGSLALLLDAQPNHGLREGLEDPSRVDGIFLENATVELNRQLRLLASEEMLGSDTAAHFANAPQVIATAATTADLVVCDLPRHLVSAKPEILAAFEHIVVVLDPSFVALRDAARLLRHLRTRHPNIKLHLVVSGRDGKVEVARRELERGLGQDVDAWLPASRDALAKAEIDGQPLAKVNPKHAFVRELAHINQDLMGTKSAEVKPFLKRVLGR